MKVALVLGTRPEIIKIAPIIVQLEREKIDYIVINTGQHYDRHLNEAFLKELELKTPNYNVGYKNESNKHFDNAKKKIKEILVTEGISVVFVQGDTNSSLLGAQVAKEKGISVCHIEAGLRSGEKSTSEERNTIAISKLATIHFCPTKKDAENLKKEGITDNIFLVGNTIVDSVKHYFPKHSGKILENFKTEEKDYILFSAGKAETVDNVGNIKKLIRILAELSKYKRVVVLLHHRLKRNLKDQNLSIGFGNIKIVEKITYKNLLSLEKKALCIITDSGGLQEEGYILGTPVVILKYSTQRPSILESENIWICGLNIDKIVKKVRSIDAHVSTKAGKKLGDGTTARKIVAITKKILKD